MKEQRVTDSGAGKVNATNGINAAHIVPADPFKGILLNLIRNLIRAICCDTVSPIFTG